MKEGKNIRNTLVWILAYIIFTIALFLYFRPSIATNMNEYAYLDALNEYRRVLLEEKKTELDIVLYSIDGPTVARKECEIGFTDEDHLRLEALLDGPGEESLENGLISYISPKTRLIGLTIRDGIAYVQLSKDFLSSKDIDKAKKQIEETLSLAYPELRVGIIIDNELI